VKLEFVSDAVGDLTKTFGPEDVFHYIYAILHCPTYRERYAEFLKIDFPRIPLTSSRPLFRKLCKLGAELTALHLMEKHGKRITSYPIRRKEDDNVVEKVRHTEPGAVESGDRQRGASPRFPRNSKPPNWRANASG
jgi:predicted helicase